jgi:hypothetical protein
VQVLCGKRKADGTQELRATKSITKDEFKEHMMAITTRAIEGFRWLDYLP